MKILTTLISAAISLLSIGAYASRPVDNQEYAKYVYTDSITNKSLPYRMLSPKIKAGETYPLVFFLHGSGERGDDNEKQLIHGASTFSNPYNCDKYPAFVVFPQCKEKSWSAATSPKFFMPGAQTPELTVSEEMLVDLIKELKSTLPIDPERIYLIGISMGGIATYDLVCRFPELFAAAVPICGAVNPDRLTNAKDVNFMIFHGAQDEEVPNICGREAYKALNSAGANVEYIEFAGMGHDCWSSAFNYPEFLPWLFSQTKQPSPDILAEANDK